MCLRLARRGRRRGTAWAGEATGERPVGILSSLRVLIYNHTALVSGAERSLLELIAGLRGSVPEVEAIAAVPDGPLRQRIEALGAETVVVRRVDATFKAHPVQTPRALAGVTAAARELRSVARQTGADVVHANSVRAGLVAVTAPGMPPVVAHVRDVLPSSPPARALAAFLRRRARGVIAISRHTADAFGGEGLEVIHNPVDLVRFDPARAEWARARGVLGVPHDAPLLTVVGQITKWKGQDDAIRALALVRETHPSAHLAIIGEPKFVARATRFDNRAYETRLRALADQVGNVIFTGEREDVPDLMAASDLVLVPSWEEPFGRTVVEAMAMGRTVLATSVGGPGEVITHGVDGWLLAPREPEAWARVVRDMLDAPDERERIGAGARERARQFDRATHARRVAAVYAAARAG